MRTQVVKMTPDRAKRYLQGNIDNRKVRRKHVSDLAEQMAAGEWKLSHQGVAIAKDGRVIDGQHRLLAVIEADIEVAMNVSFDVDSDVYLVTDTHARRSVGDILRISKDAAQVIRLATKLHFGKTTSANLEKMEQAIGHYLKDFPAFHVRYFSSASIRLAAVASIISGIPANYVIATYSNLCDGNVDALPPVAKGLMKSFVKGGLNSADMADTVARGMVVFDPDNANFNRVTVKDPANAIETVRKALVKALA